MKNTFIVFAACLLTAGIVLGAIVLGFYLKDNGGITLSSDTVFDAAAVTSETETDSNFLAVSPEETSKNSLGIKPSGSIIIPGYEKLTFKAGSREQKVLLKNPEANECYFMISILLADNTEIFHSELLAPGSSLTKIKLSRSLDPGIYENAMMRYSCFDMETLQGLNGANTKLNLEVTHE